MSALNLLGANPYVAQSSFGWGAQSAVYGSPVGSSFGTALSPFGGYGTFGNFASSVTQDPFQSYIQPIVPRFSSAAQTAVPAADNSMQMMMMMLMSLLGRRSQPSNLLSQLGGGTGSVYGDLLTPPEPNVPAPSWSGATGGTWGDPHFKDLTNKSANKYDTDFDVTGEAGKVYSILNDKNIQFNSRFVKGDPTQGTIMGQIGIKLRGDDGKDHQVEFDAMTGKGKFDGQDMKEGQKVTLKVGGEDATIEFKKGEVFGRQAQTMAIHTKEYDINLEEAWDTNHANQTVKVNKDGVMTDWVNPHGLLGQTADGDDNVRVGKKGVGVQGEGAIDYNYKKYEVSDLFATADQDINRYGIQVGKVVVGGKVTKTYNKATGELLATLDKDGKLVSTRKIEQADGSIKLTLADGVTEINRAGDIIKQPAPEAEKPKA